MLSDEIEARPGARAAQSPGGSGGGRRMLGLARATFAVLLAVTLYKALEPPGVQAATLQDKALHFSAFYALAVSATLAAPRTGLLVVAAWLAGLGLVIEGLQALPAIHRSADALDVVADLAGVAAALAPFAVAHLRNLLRLGA